MAWAGSAGVQESLEQTASCSTTAHPCWLAPPWNTSLEMWVRLTAGDGCKSTSARWQWGRDLLKVFHHFRDSAASTARKHSYVSLRCFQLILVLRPVFYSARNSPLSSFVVVLQGQFGDNSVNCHLWDVVDSDYEGPRKFASVLVLYLLVYWGTTFILGWVAEFWKAASGVIQVVKDVFRAAA